MCINNYFKFCYGVSAVHSNICACLPFRSLGCTVVEMFTKNPPWHEFEPMAAIFKVATCDHPKYELAPKVSGLARTFLKLCFRKAQSERPTAQWLLDNSEFVNKFT